MVFVVQFELDPPAMESIGSYYCKQVITEKITYIWGITDWQTTNNKFYSINDTDWAEMY